MGQLGTRAVCSANMTEDIYEKSVGEAADIIATAQRLIEAGVKSKK